MQQWLQLYGPDLLDRYNLVLRLLLAACLGGMIGLEREASGKPAGFRTNLLICLGAALITEISFMMKGSGDPGRIAAQIVSGIGFLGAGSILQSRNGGGVTGLTTAATLWVVAAIGMAVGARAYLAALVATTLVMLALMILGRVEDHLIPRRPSERQMDVSFTSPGENISLVEDQLNALGFAVALLSAEKRTDIVIARFKVHGISKKWDDALQTLLNIHGVQKIELT